MNGFDLSTASNIMYGSIQVESVYYGGTLIWSQGGEDYSTKYFTIEALEPIDITWNSGVQINTLQYSLDNGSSWTTINPSETIYGLNTNDKVLFKGNIQSGGDWTGSGSIASTGQYDVYGNIMSLIDGDNFIGSTTPLGTWMFWHLFAGTPVVNAEHLVLPTDDLTVNDVTCVYMEMFANCTNLTTAPALTATTVGHESCARMFQNCTSLTTASEISATTIGWASFGGMFEGCTSLVNAPSELPATTLDASCYQRMFAGCTSLTTAPALPATTIAPYCYNSMFEGCTSLVNAPSELPATDIPYWCYVGMFKNCSSLTTAPALPATRVGDTAYADMFEGCTSLTTAPVLPATVLSAYCYSRMFYGCSSLAYIDIYVEECDNYSAFNEWLNGVAASGTVDCYQSLGLPIDDPSGIPVGWTASYKQPHDYSQDYLTLEALEPNTITWYDDINQNTIDYSLDNGIVWSQLTAGSSINLNTGDKALFKAANLQIDQNSGIGKFGSTGQFSIYGNIMSLINADNFVGTTIISNNQFRNLFRDSGVAKANHLILPSTTVPDNAYNGMFAGTYSLTRVPELPATTLGESCYGSMFFLSGITTAPALPATTMAPYCYDGMFNSSGLTIAPALPAMTLAADCYQNMFRDCQGLTTAPALPATTMANECYAEMFNNCQNLTTAPVLQATSLAWGCYRGMFSNCTSLTTAPQLPATTLVDRCYQDMFSGCSSLVNAPQLPAGTMTEWCYRGMFARCSNLVNAPQLPATSVYDACYADMFNGCTSLTTAPALPATTLDVWCYAGMFKDCTSLTTAPQLPATSLTDYCYGEMFNGCTSLTYVNIDAQNYSGAPFTNWLNNVAASGTVECYQSLGLPIDDPSGIPLGWTPNYKTPPYERMYLTLETEEPITITWNDIDNNNSIEYSQDNGSSWNTLTAGSNIPNLNTGDKVLFRASNLLITNGIGIFNATGQFSVYGNIMSLVNGDNFENTANLSAHQFDSLFLNAPVLNAEHLILPTSTNDYCYFGMFKDCTSLTTAPSLPSTSLSSYCYQSMFEGCTSLTATPALPATTLADNCYQNMFNGCTSLTTAPTLPATSLATRCYTGMFKDCTSLTTAPTLSATTLADYCYRAMFANCTSLTTAPALPATTLTDYCYYNMFGGCTNLTTAPTLSATTLASECYQLMFMGCTSLTTAPALPATTLADSCYSGMFSGCTSLTSAPALPATTLADNCYNGMFEDCTLLTSAPTLPATTLADHCYYSMFARDTSLTTAPALPATTLADGAYMEMFNGCTSLTYVDIDAQSNTYSNVFSNWLNNVAASGTVDCYQSLGLPTNDVSGIPLGWTANYKTSPYERMYLTLEAVEPTDITWVGNHSNNSLHYSLDNGTTWNNLTTGSNIPNLNVGDKVLFKALHLQIVGGIGEFSATGKIDVYGNIMSLENGDNFVGTTNISADQFSELFNDAPIRNAEHLILPTATNDGCYRGMFQDCILLTTAPTLPATTLSNRCYYRMFRNCRGLTTAPTLPATTLADYCYSEMFYLCTSLIYVNIDAQNKNAPGVFDYWLYNVATSGTIECYQSLDLSTNDPSGIPSFWTANYK